MGSLFFNKRCEVSGPVEEKILLLKRGITLSKLIENFNIFNDKRENWL